MFCLKKAFAKDLIPSLFLKEVSKLKKALFQNLLKYF